MLEETQTLTLEDLQQAEKKHQLEEALRDEQFEGEAARFSMSLITDDNKNLPNDMMREKRIAELFWAFFDKDITLSNFEEQDVKFLMRQLELAKLNVLMEYPDYALNFNDVRNLNLMRVKAFAKVKRATGGINRERALQASQIKQILGGSEESPKGGFFSRLIGKAFGGSK